MSLSETLIEAIRLRDQMRTDGATEAELTAGFEKVLREVWPTARTWRYLCETCRDYGLEMKACPGDATCGRTFPHAAHDYGDPCWCKAGNRYKSKARDDDPGGAGAKRKPSRFGR